MTYSENMEKLEADFALFRQSMNDWIIYLNDSQKEIRERMLELEKRIAKLEMDIHLRF